MLCCFCQGLRVACEQIDDNVGIEKCTHRNLVLPIISHSLQVLVRIQRGGPCADGWVLGNAFMKWCRPFLRPAGFYQLEHFSHRPFKVPGGLRLQIDKLLLNLCW